MNYNSAWDYAPNKNGMAIWHISDSHTYHDQLKIPFGIDMVIHSGDGTNSKDTVQNTKEFLNFIEWFRNLPIRYRVFVAGNHDVVTERQRFWPDDIRDMGIIYLENESIEIDGFNFWGSPYTPTFMDGWAWNMSRGKIGRVWDTIPDDTDVVITHGPPKGTLDYTLDRKNKLEAVGCANLAKRIEQIQPRAHLFGHVHSCKWIKNAGTYFAPDGTVYSNGSLVKDGEFGKLISNGNVFQLNKRTV